MPENSPTSVPSERTVPITTPAYDAKRDVLDLPLPFEVCLERVGGLTQVFAADDTHHRRKQPEGALRPHLEFVVDARRVTQGGEKEAVPAFERPDVGNDANVLWP